MSFTSLQFFAFFPIVVLLYFCLPYRFRNPMLLTASLYFYAVWNPPYVLQLLVAIGASYYLAIRIEDSSTPQEKKLYCVAGIVLLAGHLFVFKYFNFFNESVAALLHALNMPYMVPAVHLLLPLGISFYTFQLISYIVDVYKGAMKAERRFHMLALYLSFFPHLVAGPIERAINLLPQFSLQHDFDYKRMSLGLQRMAWGFFKKLVVADRLAPFVETVYGNPQAQDGVGLTLATLLFAFQVYCDFSGYSDIAIGAAQTLGYRLTNNFNRPYAAVSIQDFWKRWHITLSSWLTDYVFTPLTRSRLFRMKWYYILLASLFVTFLVSGLWHGARWTYVVWGALHGTYIVSSMLSQRLRRKVVVALGLDKAPALHHALKVAMTFTLICLSYVLFRATSLSDAAFIYTHLFSGWTEFATNLVLLRNPVQNLFIANQFAEFLIGLYGIAVVILVDTFQGYERVQSLLATRPAVVRWSVYYAEVASVVLLGAFYLNDGQQFIYFQF